jgi:hypothetical protein
MKEKEVEIAYHVYNCHPETCCHDTHNSWWVKDNNLVWAKLESKKQAIKYCTDNGFDYTIKVPTWDQYC